MEIITIILLLVIQVKTQDMMTGSGDGEGFMLTTSYASLIDDYGDFENISVYDSDASTDRTPLDNETDSESISNDTTPFFEIAGDQSTSTPTPTDTTVVIMGTSDSQVTSSTSVASTITTESSSTTDVPTTTVTTTETTTPTTTTTTTTVKPTTKRSTTTLSSTVTDETEPQQTSKVSPVPTMEPKYIPADGEEPCSFMDDNLTCEVDITCYGEGEITCYEEENSPAETTFMDKIALSSVSEDYPEYDGDGIETFPPNLVGVNPTKKRLHFAFRMGALATTPIAEDIFKTTAEESTSSTTISPKTRQTSEMPIFDEIPIEETGGQRRTTAASALIRYSTYGMRPAAFSHDKKATVESDSLKYSSSVLPSTTTSSQTESEKIPSSTEASLIVMTTMQDVITTIQNATSLITTELSADGFTNTRTEDSHVPTVNVRRKREESVVYGSLPFHMAVENSKKKSSNCRITGNLACSPSPKAARCKGKTVCRVVRSTAETSEKSTSTKGVESWAIAVIAICAIAAALTVSLLVYLIITSWKKLKVQPQNGVTTLTYVNSTVP